MAMAVTTTENTAAIMSTEAHIASGPNVRRQQSWGLVLLAACIGMALITLAVPRIAAYGPLVSFGPVRAALDQGTDVHSARLDAASEALGRAGQWLPAEAAILRDRARVGRRLAAIAGDPEMAIELQRSAAVDLRAAAAAAPFDAFNWALLADAEIAAGKAPEDVLPALRLARLTGPRKASAILLQHGIVMRHWTSMPEEMRAHAMADAAVFWRRAPYRPFLLESYLDAGFAARAAFRRALAADDPRLLDHLDRMLVGDAARRKR